MRQLALVGLGLAAIAIIVLISYWEEQDWVKACVADGNKKYVCQERYSAAHPPAPVTNVHTTVHTH